MGDLKVIKTRISTVKIRSDGILQVDMFPNAEFKLSDAIDNMNAQAQLAAGVKRPLLVNTGQTKSMDREARTLLASEEAGANLLATALVIQSPVGRVISNFFMGFNRAHYPVRMFNSELEAVKWLKGFL